MHSEPDVVGNATTLVVREFGDRCFPLKHVLCLDFEELKLNTLILCGPSAKTCQYSKSFIASTLGHKPTWTADC